MADVALRDGTELPFWATISSRSTVGSVNIYGWEEVQPLATFAFTEMTAARSGSSSSSPAFEANNRLLSVGQIVRMVRGYYDPPYGWVYIATESVDCEPVSLDVMTCASLIQDADDNVIGLQIARRQVSVDERGCWTVGPTICEINPPDCCPDDSGSGSGSGAIPWWCVEVQNCEDSGCVDCEPPSGVECVNYAFSAVGDSRCVALGGIYRREVAVYGPFNNQNSCKLACGGVSTSCCGVVPQSLCALLSDGGGAPDAAGLSLDLAYVGIADVPCSSTATDCTVCSGLVGPTWFGSITYCGHPAQLTLSCASDGYWYAKVRWTDFCGPVQYFSDCNGTLAVLQCTPKFHLRLAVDVPDACTCGGSGSGGGGGTVPVNCCPFGVSTSLTLTIAGSFGLGTCGCLLGTYPLVYNSGTGKWQWSGMVCAMAATITFECIGDAGNRTFRLQVIGPSGEDGQSFEATCSPFSWAVGGVGIIASGLCAGNVDFVVTE